MKVYIVYPDYDFDGCGIPEAAFTSIEEAKEFIRKAANEGLAPRRMVSLDVAEPTRAHGI